MNPSSDPRAALDEGLYVSPPRGAAGEDLASRLELEPDSSHRVIGATGAGKTSELLQAAARLKASLPEAGDHVEYIDVSLKHDLSAPNLSGGTGRARRTIPREPRAGEPRGAEEERARSFDKSAREACQQVWMHLDDLPRDDDDDDDADNDDLMEVPGVIVPPKDPINPKLAPLVDHLRIIQTAYPGDGYEDGKRWVVHPTLVPLLDAMIEAA